MRKLRELAQEAVSFVHSHRKLCVTLLVALVVTFPIGYAFADSNTTELFKEFVQNPTETLLLTGAGVLNAISAMIGNLTILLINVLIVPILGYNSFSTSNVISLGWSLTRDIVNMFVVVLLLVLAIMTLVGYQKANWTQQLPKLFIAIVLVNFSRTICGVLIDVSQVIMFTFVNAIIDVAAGNFAQLFNLSDFGTFNANYIARVNESGDGLSAASMFMAALFQIPLYISIAVVMFLLAVAFVWRIVVLWMVVIMAPIAFLMYFAKDLFGKAGDVYKEWWSKLVNALTLGPVLSMFTWLALASASGSNMARAENFPMPKNEDEAVTGLPNKEARLENFTGTLLALVFLILGLAQSAGAASALGGLAKSALGGGEELGKKIVKGAANPKMWGKTGISVASRVAPGITNTLAKSAVGVGAAIAARRGGGMLGKAIAGVGNSAYSQSDKVLAAKKKEMLEGLKNTAPAYRENLYKSMAENGGKGGNLYKSLSKAEQAAFAGSLLSSTKEQKKAKEAIEKRHNMSTSAGKAAAEKEYNDLLSSQIEAYDGAKDQDAYGLDDAGKKAFNALKVQNLHLLRDPKGGDREAYIKKFVADANKKGEFDARLLSKDALGDSAVKAALMAEKSTFTDKDGNPITMLDAAKQGRYGSQVADAFRPDPKTLSASSFALPGPSSTATPDEQARQVSDVVSRIENLTKSGGVAQLDKTSLDELKAALADSRVKGAVSYSVSSQAEAQMLRGYEKVPGASIADAATQVIGPLPPPSGGAISATVQGKIESTIHSDPVNIRFLDGSLPDLSPATGASAGHNEVSRVAYESLKPEDLKKIQDQMKNATGAELDKVKQAMDSVEKVLQSQRTEVLAMVAGKARDKEMKKLQALERVHDTTKRYSR